MRSQWCTDTVNAKNIKQTKYFENRNENNSFENLKIVMMVTLAALHVTIMTTQSAAGEDNCHNHKWVFFGKQFWTLFPSPITVFCFRTKQSLSCMTSIQVIHEHFVSWSVLFGYFSLYVTIKLCTCEIRLYDSPTSIEVIAKDSGSKAEHSTKRE